MFRRPDLAMVDANMQSDIVGNNNIVDQDMNVDINMNGGMVVGGGCPQPCPINEAVKQNCVHRTFVHEVPHVCPIHTKIINHHVYKHTYQPAYSCSEENVVSNVQEGSCCQFH